MRMILLLTIAAVLCLTAIVGPSSAFIGGYGNGTQFNTTLSSGSVTTYQVMVNLSNSSGVSGPLKIYTNGTTLPNWYDVVFADSSDAQLPFWIENGTSTSSEVTAWVRVPQIDTVGTTIRFYYGNLSKTSSLMDGRSTFPLFDDFNTYDSPNNWSNTSGTPSVSGSELTLSNAQIKSNKTFGVNNSVRGMTKYNAIGNIDYRYITVGFASASADEYEGHTVDHDSATFNNKWGNTNDNYAHQATSSTSGFSANTYAITEISRNGSTSVIYSKDNSVQAAHTTYVPIKPAYVNIRSTKGGNSNPVLTAHWVFIRNYTSPEPTTSEYSTLVSGNAPVASFTTLSNPSINLTEVQFTDTSTNTPTSWGWTFGDGNYTSNTTQTPKHLYVNAGAFSVCLNATNAFGSNTTCSNQVVNEASGFNQQDIYMEGQFVTTFHVIDSYSAPVSNVSVVVGSTTAATDSSGNANYTATYGVYSATFIKEGYVTKSQSFVVDGDQTIQITMTSTTASATSIDLSGTPKDVKFHIQSFWGAPIMDATVAIQGVTTTTGSWDWVSQLLSIDLDETPIQNTSMSGLTDSNGDAVFLMLDSIKYNVSVSRAGYTFPATFISPQASQYTISANMNESWFASGNDTLKEVNVSVSWVTKNATHAFVNVSYRDDTGTTTGGDIMIYSDSVRRAANRTPIAIMNITGSTCSNSSVVSVPVGGASFTTVVNATTPNGNVVRTFTHSFKGEPVNLPGWTPETQLWLAVFLLVFTAAFAGVLHAPQMSIILCVELWVFWAIGWFDYLIDWNGYAEAGLLILFTLATFLAVIWNITEGKSKGKRRS